MLKIVSICPHQRSRDSLKFNTLILYSELGIIYFWNNFTIFNPHRQITLSKKIKIKDTAEVAEGIDIVAVAIIIIIINMIMVIIMIVITIILLLLWLWM